MLKTYNEGHIIWKLYKQGWSKERILEYINTLRKMDGKEEMKMEEL